MWLKFHTLTLCIINFIPTQDIGISVVFALSLLAGGAASAAYSSDNSDYYDDSRCDQFDVSVCDDLDTVRGAEAASAVSFNMV